MVPLQSSSACKNPLISHLCSVFPYKLSGLCWRTTDRSTGRIATSSVGQVWSQSAGFPGSHRSCFTREPPSNCHSRMAFAQACTVCGGGPYAPVCMGDVEMLTRYRDGLEEVEFVSSQAAGNILLIINLLAGIAALGLFILHPSDREYLWFSGFELSNAVFAALGDYNYWYLHSGKVEGLLGNSFYTAGYLMFLVFLRTLLRQPRNFLYWFAIITGLLSVLIEVPRMLERISESDYFIVGFALYVPFCVGVLTMLVRGVRTSNQDAALLVGPVALTFSAVFFNGVIGTIPTIGLPDVREHFGWFYTLFTWPFPVSVQNILDASMQLSVLAILVLRFARTRRDEERLKTEFESARTVQQVLVPDEVPEHSRLRDPMRVQARRSNRRRFLPGASDQKWRSADCHWRRERQRASSRNDSISSRWDSANSGPLHSAPGGNLGSYEPADARAEQGRVHHLPRSAH